MRNHALALAALFSFCTAPAALADNPHLEWLRAQGFGNAEKMLESVPELAEKDIETELKPNLEMLKSYGYSVQTITPYILAGKRTPKTASERQSLNPPIDSNNRSKSTLAKQTPRPRPRPKPTSAPTPAPLTKEEKIEKASAFLESKGFTDPAAIIEKHPNILKISQEKFGALWKIHTEILGLSLEDLKKNPFAYFVAPEKRILSLIEELTYIGIEAKMLPSNIKKQIALYISVDTILKHLKAEGHIKLATESLAGLDASERESVRKIVESGEFQLRYFSLELRIPNAKRPDSTQENKARVASFMEAQGFSKESIDKFLYAQKDIFISFEPTFMSTWNSLVNDYGYTVPELERYLANLRVSADRISTLASDLRKLGFDTRTLDFLRKQNAVRLTKIENVISNLKTEALIRNEVQSVDDLNAAEMQKIKELIESGEFAERFVTNNFKPRRYLQRNSVQEFHDTLRKYGVAEEKILQISKNLAFIPDAEKTEKILKWFVEHGTKDVGTFISSYPHIFQYAADGVLNEKFEWLKSKGSENPMKSLLSYPSMVGYNIEKNLEPTWRLLTEVFKFAPSRIFGSPSVFGASISRVDKIIQEFAFLNLQMSDLSIGFREKIIRTLSIEKIIAVLKDRQAIPQNAQSFKDLNQAEKKKLKEIVVSENFKRDYLGKPQGSTSSIENCENSIED